MKNKKYSLRAFSLVELLIVLFVISLLLALVFEGTSLVSSARINNARSFTVKSVVPEIPGLIAWYETSLIDSIKAGESVNNAQISEWRDISPSSVAAQKNKLTKTASANLIYKIEGINQIPSLLFDGNSNAKLTLSNFYQGTSPVFTIFLVFQPSITPAVNTILGGIQASPNQTSISLTSPTTIQLDAGTAAATNTTNNSASFAQGDDYILSAYFNSTSSQVFVNNVTARIGLDVSDGSPSGILSTGTNPLNGLTIGSNPPGTSTFPGFISEIIIYNRPLQIQERRDIFKYLSNKYNISVTGL